MKPCSPPPIVASVLVAACCLLLGCDSSVPAPGPAENAFKVDHRGLSYHGKPITLQFPPDATLAVLGQGARTWIPPAEVPTNRIHIYDELGVSLFEPVESPETKGLWLEVQLFLDPEKILNTQPKTTFQGRIWLRGASLVKGMRRAGVQRALTAAKLPFATQSWGYRVVYGPMQAGIFFTGTSMAPQDDDLLRLIVLRAAEPDPTSAGTPSAGENVR